MKTYRNCSRCKWEKAPSGIVLKAALTIVLRNKETIISITTIIITVNFIRIIM